MDEELLDQLKKRIFEDTVKKGGENASFDGLGRRAQGMLKILRAMPPGAHNMCEIVGWLVSHRRTNELTTVLLGRSASTAPSCIVNGTDVCCKCTEDEPCARRLAGLPAGVDRSALLRAYRLDVCDNFLGALESSPECAALLLQDPLLLKFAASYELTSAAKQVMRSAGHLSKQCRVLRKDHGKYCPKRDYWEVGCVFRRCRPLGSAESDQSFRPW